MPPRRPADALTAAAAAATLAAVAAVAVVAVLTVLSSCGWTRSSRKPTAVPHRPLDYTPSTLPTALVAAVALAAALKAARRLPRRRAVLAVAACQYSLGRRPQR